MYFKISQTDRKKIEQKNFKSDPVELDVWLHVQAYQQRANSVYGALKRKKKTSKRYTLRVIFSMYVQIQTKMGHTHKYPKKRPTMEMSPKDGISCWQHDGYAFLENVRKMYQIQHPHNTNTHKSNIIITQI